jgi:hypothetical protein
MESILVEIDMEQLVVGFADGFVRFGVLVWQVRLWCSSANQVGGNTIAADGLQC